MAGRVKHMERSRRSHRNDANVFLGFERRAYKIANVKQQRMTLGQLLASMLAPLRDTMKRAVPESK